MNDSLRGPPRCPSRRVCPRCPRWSPAGCPPPPVRSGRVWRNGRSRTRRNAASWNVARSAARRTGTSRWTPGLRSFCGPETETNVSNKYKNQTKHKVWLRRLTCLSSGMKGLHGNTIHVFLQNEVLVECDLLHASVRASFTNTKFWEIKKKEETEHLFFTQAEQRVPSGFMVKNRPAGVLLAFIWDINTTMWTLCQKNQNVHKSLSSQVKIGFPWTQLFQFWNWILVVFHWSFLVCFIYFCLWQRKKNSPVLSKNTLKT